MKQALVQTLEQSGHTFGQVNNPDDLMKAQDFAHERVSGVVSDFINRSSRPEIVGFDQTLGAGTAFNMTVAKGRVYTQNGISYDRDSSTTVTFDAAHATLPRIDIVVAKIEDEVDSALDLIPFVRLRTPDEFTDEVPAYPPSNINAPTEKHWKATVIIKKGTAAETPAKPTLASNEIPLYEVIIGAASISLQGGNIIDRRGTADTVRILTDRDVAHQAALAELQRRISAVEDIGGQPIDLTQIFGDIRSLEEILSDLLTRATSSADYPEIRYNTKHGGSQYNSWDIGNWKTRATGAFGSGVAHIDFDLGLAVNFGDAEVLLTPESFEDPDLNARFYTPAGNETAHMKQSFPLTLNDVTPGASDGTVGFGGTGVHLTPARGRAAICARDERYVEIFGGHAADNYSALSDWHTYDRENNTLVARTFNLTLPASDRPALFPYGDGDRLLVICGNAGDVAGSPRVFTVNATAGTAVEHTLATPFTGNEFVGALVSDQHIFIMSDKYSTGTVKFWEFNVSSQLNAELNTTGNVPGEFRDRAMGCYYAENQFIFVGQELADTTDVGPYTFIFDRTTLQWTKISVNLPFERFNNIDGYRGGYAGARMANVNGRPVITGGFHLNSNGLDNLGYDASWAYELAYTVPVPQLTSSFGKAQLAWKEFLIAMPRTVHHSFCSMLQAAPNSGTLRATGFGVKTGGASSYLAAQTEVYTARAAGLIASSFNGEAAISIADGSTFAQFEIDPYSTAWDVTGYLVGITGAYTAQTLKLHLSEDDGVTWTEINPYLAISRPAAPMDRRLRVTLYRGKAQPPVVSLLTEVIDTDSGLDLEQRTVIRIDTPQDEEFYALHIDRLGKARFTNTSNPPFLEPSTGGKCLLLLMIANAGEAPTLTKLINRRRPIEKISAVKSAATTEDVYTSLAVPVRYFEVIGIATGTKHVYKPTEHPNAGSTFRMSVQIVKAEIPEGDTYEVTFYG